MKPFTSIFSCLFGLIFMLHAHAQKRGLAAIDSMKAQLLTIKHPDTNAIKTIYRISDAYKNVNSDSAMQYSVRGLAMAKKEKWDKGIAAFYDGIGSLYSNNSDYVKALQYYNASLKINQRIGNKRNMAGNLINIASVYQRQGSGVKALEYDFKALKITQAIGEKRWTALLYANIADVYFAQKNYSMSLSYHLKAHKVYQDIDELNGIAKVTDGIANVYAEQQRPGEAEIYYQRSLKIYREQDNKLGEAQVLSHMALLQDKNQDKKLALLMQAQQLFDEINPLHAGSIANLGNIGGLYADIFIYSGKDKNTYEKAERYLKRAISSSKETGDNDSFSYFSAELALLQEHNGDYRHALQNYKLSQRISDSLYSQESKNKIASMEAGYAFQKKENEYKQQQQLAKLRMKQVYLYGALALVVVSSILIFLLNRSRIRQLRLKNELQKKQAEEQTKELLYRNKLSESELKAIRAQMNPHFIFNVLNSIESYIVENDAKTASRLVQKFASLSRLILENSTQSLVTADREWKALKLYTELEAMRFNNQFSYDFYADPQIDLATVLLPPMLVQPLIENSIHHGMRNSTAENNTINIRLEQTLTTILFTVEDNGLGIDETQKFKTFTAIKSKSIGLSAIRERIEIFNAMNEGMPATFEIYKKDAALGTGTIAKLSLPKIFRELSKKTADLS